MTNKSKLELHFYIDEHGKSVDPSTPNAKRLIVMPGAEITPILSEQERHSLIRTGHIDPTEA